MRRKAKAWCCRNRLWKVAAKGQAARTIVDAWLEKLSGDALTPDRRRFYQERDDLPPA